MSLKLVVKRSLDLGQPSETGLFPRPGGVSPLSAVRPFSVRQASARGHKRLRGVAPNGLHRCGPHQRALKALVLG
jgi:hypothetical protein